MAELRDLLVIEDSFIHKMLADPKYVSEFPFLRQYAAQAKSQAATCGRCGNRKARSKAIDYTEIKRSLAAMPAQKKARLLELSNARAVRLIYKNLRNEVVKMTINRGI